MTNVTIEGQVGPQVLGDGVNSALRAGRSAELVVTELHGRYYEQSKRGNLFVAHAIVTAPVIYSTAANTGGPLIWNPPSSGVDVVLLGFSFGVTVVTTVAAALGITGNTGQTAAPGSTTTIDSRGSGYISAATSRSTPYRIGTPTNAGGFFYPLADLHTGALTVDNRAMNTVDLGGSIICPPGCWVSVAASATATTTVAQLALVYEEVPV